MNPKILLENNKERENRKSEEKGSKRKKIAIAALLVFILTSLEIVFERKKNCLRQSFILAVT